MMSGSTTEDGKSFKLAEMTGNLPALHQLIHAASILAAPVDQRLAEVYLTFYLGEGGRLCEVAATKVVSSKPGSSRFKIEGYLVDGASGIRVRVQGSYSAESQDGCLELVKAS